MPLTEVFICSITYLLALAIISSSRKVASPAVNGTGDAIGSYWAAEPKPFLDSSCRMRISGGEMARSFDGSENRLLTVNISFKVFAILCVVLSASYISWFGREEYRYDVRHLHLHTTRIHL
jgi:hypothetical protein